MSQDMSFRRQETSVLNVAEQYGGSIIVLRWLGCWIDMVGSLSCLLLPALLLSNELYRKTVFVWLALALSYFVVGEWLWGRTLGKLLTGTIVVDQNGNRPSLGQVLVRTVFRVFEINPLLAGGVPAGIAAVLSKRKQRLGDMAANTYVIRARDLGKIARPSSIVSGLAPRGSYFARHWHGELTLPSSFWRNGLVGGLLLAIAENVAAVLAVAGGDVRLGNIRLVSAMLICFMPINAAFLIWVGVGIWRSADRYGGSRVWAILAQATVVIGGTGFLLRSGLFLATMMGLIGPAR